MIENSEYWDLNKWFDVDSEEDAIGLLEETMNCAGMCSVSPYYSFSDTSRGPPT